MSFNYPLSGYEAKPDNCPPLDRTIKQIEITFTKIALHTYSTVRTVCTDNWHVRVYLPYTRGMYVL